MNDDVTWVARAKQNKSGKAGESWGPGAWDGSARAAGSRQHGGTSKDGKAAVPSPCLPCHWVTPLRFDALQCEAGQTAASRILRVGSNGSEY